MASNDEALNINSLPEEMLINIFSRLSQNELGRMARVCRRWNVLTKDPVFWKEVNVKLHRSHKSPNTVTRCFLKILPPSVSCITLDFGFALNWTEQFNFEELCLELQRRCPCLKMLVLKGAVLSDNLSSIIGLCTAFLQDLNILKVHHSSFTGRSSLLPGGELGGTSNIEVLDISQSWLQHCNKPPFSRMPHLKQLRLSYTNADDSWFKGDISFLNQLHELNVGKTWILSSMFSVIRDNGLNLKELYCCDIRVLDDELNFNNSVFPHLKTICLRHCSSVTCEGIVSLIQSCQSLQNVYVSQKVAALYAKHPFIVANKCKLEIVKFISDCEEHRRVSY